MANILIQLISIIGNLVTLLIIVDAVLSFVMQPYHPIRQTLGQILNPLYAPIRRLIPPLGTFDITPLILILLIQVVESILISLLSSI